jgi:hypothetical protein
MKEVNYNETVILPLLQKKVQELSSSNLVLEAHLMVEQARNKDLQLRLDELQAKLDSTSKKKKKDVPTLDGETY